MLSVGVLLVCLVATVHGHGRMFHPIGRSSMWRYGYDVPPNYNDHELNCGGFQNHWGNQGGKCGICGDPWQGPRENEAGGTYASGIIPSQNQFSPGEVIEVLLDIHANHDGWNEFRVCVNNDVNTPATQECLDQNLLELADGSGTRWYLPSSDNRNYTVQVRLPQGLTCDQCVMQWRWVCGNRWDCEDGCENPDVDNCGMGCGNQEHFYSCADLSVG